jgi:hypothetical protein
MHLVLSYRSTNGALALSVPAMNGFTPLEAAHAAYVATHMPPSETYPAFGAREIAVAYFARPSSAQALAPLSLGDVVHAGGAVLRLVAEQPQPGLDVRPRHAPVFEVIEAGVAGPVMYVTASVAPPDNVRYVLDRRGRVWTGSGGGVWTCLTDPSGRAPAVSWRSAFLDFGPLQPLVAAAPSMVCTMCRQYGGGRCDMCSATSAADLLPVQFPAPRPAAVEPRDRRRAQAPTS